MIEGIIRKKVLREVFSQLCDIGKKKGDFSLPVALFIMLWNTDYGDLMLSDTFSTLKLEVSTRGWKDNEELLFALESTLFWEKFWIGWKRGGSYLFEIPWTLLSALKERRKNGKVY